MKYFFCVAIFFLILAGCSSSVPSERRQWIREQNKIKVLCMTEQVSHLVRLVGKEHVAIYTLIPKASDPHTYQIRRGDGELLSSADVLVFSGLGLERTAGFSKYTELPQALFVGEAIVKKHPSQAIYAGREIDPHIWMDASLWAEGISAIEEALVSLVPEKKEEFSLNAKKAKKELLELHDHILHAMAKLSLEKRYLVTTHESFRYFTRAYLASPSERASGSWKDRCHAPEGISPESEMGLYELERLMQYIEKYQVSVLFPEYGVTQDSLKRAVALLKEKGFSIRLAQQVLYSDAVGPHGGYQDMLMYDAHTIVEAFCGK